jgi:hypothetical protein
MEAVRRNRILIGVAIRTLSLREKMEEPGECMCSKRDDAGHGERRMWTTSSRHIDLEKAKHSKS